MITLAFLTCSVDPAYSTALASLIGTPQIALIVWLLWRGTKAWRGRETMVKPVGSHFVITPWAVTCAVFWANFPAIVYFTLGSIAASVWLQSTFG